MKRILALSFCLLATACAPKALPPQSGPANFVAVTLGNAAEQAHGELAMLAKLRGEGLQPLLPAPDPALDKAVSISWTGPASGALKEICLKTGFKYQEKGKPSAQRLMVVVNGFNRSAYDIIEDIAWQIQPQAVVKVDSISRIITLAGTGKAGE
jgi:hypothetical protein